MARLSGAEPGNDGIELKERKSCLTDAGVLTYRKHMHVTSNAWHKQSIARMSTI